MHGFSSNHYEDVFESWLIDNRVQYVAVDQHKRTAFARNRIKSFDFLLYPAKARSEIIIAEIKGRVFRGTSLTKLAGLQSWVTIDDVRSLIRWEQVFGKGYVAAFIFAYRFENVDVECDGREVYDFDRQKYFFLSIRLDDYRSYMTVRSPKWQTVSLPADCFRNYAIDLKKLLS
jgi:hypothetical protein